MHLYMYNHFAVIFSHSCSLHVSVFNSSMSHKTRHLTYSNTSTKANAGMQIQSQASHRLFSLQIYSKNLTKQIQLHTTWYYSSDILFDFTELTQVFQDELWFFSSLYSDMLMNMCEGMYRFIELFSHTYMGDNIVKQVFHYTLFYKTGHLKVDPNLWRRGGQEVGQA